jgi:hypothetical protein
LYTSKYKTKRGKMTIGEQLDLAREVQLNNYLDGLDSNQMDYDDAVEEFREYLQKELDRLKKESESFNGYYLRDEFYDLVMEAL